MRFAVWKNWVESQPFVFRCFIYLVLFRSVVDLGHSFILPGASINVLQAVGIFTFGLITLALTDRRIPRRQPSRIDKYVCVLLALISVNLILFLLFDYSVYNAGLALKIFFPFYFYFFLRKFIQGKTDLEGILTTILYSTALPAILLIYELIFGPISFHVGRGGIRYQGGYEDVFTYSINIFLALLAGAYFYLKASSDAKLTHRIKYIFFIIVVMAILGAMNIHHNLTNLTLLSIFLLIALNKFRMQRSLAVFFLVLFLPLVYLFFKKTIEEKRDVMLQYEMSIIRGEGDYGRVFHGRGNRWFRYFNTWSELPIGAHLFGVPMIGMKSTRIMISAGMHSDYVRFLFTFGVVGLLIYLIFLMKIYFSSKYLALPEKFCVSASVIIVVLFSVTALPFLYAPLLYGVMSVFSYAALTRTDPIRVHNKPKWIEQRGKSSYLRQDLHASFSPRYRH